MNQNNPKFIFFGTDLFAVTVLTRLLEKEIIPFLIITTPDKPQGRKLILTPSPVNVWATEHSIPILQPETLNDAELVQNLSAKHTDFFLVVSYGKIIPENILNIPTKGTLNIHPSLLPKLRGASPLETALLQEDTTGTTIMLLDNKMDHGPIIAQKEYVADVWPTDFFTLTRDLAIESADLLAEVLPDFLSGEITPQKQNHTDATFTQKITKQDGLINLNDNPLNNYRKFLAFKNWPRSYFITSHNGKNIRLIITEAHLEDDQFTIDRVIPEGKKEMLYSDFLKGRRNS